MGLIFPPVLHHDLNVVIFSRLQALLDLETSYFESCIFEANESDKMSEHSVFYINTELSMFRIIKGCRLYVS